MVGDASTLAPAMMWATAAMLAPNSTSLMARHYTEICSLYLGRKLLPLVKMLVQSPTGPPSSARHCGADPTRREPTRVKIVPRARSNEPASASLNFSPSVTPV